MEGEYDSYGRVFTSDREDSIFWEIGWGKACDLDCSSDNSSGIAAIHSKCFRTVPTTSSKNDPNQGWGNSAELLGNCDTSLEL